MVFFGGFDAYYTAYLYLFRLLVHSHDGYSQLLIPLLAGISIMLHTLGVLVTRAAV